MQARILTALCLVSLALLPLSCCSNHLDGTLSHLAIILSTCINQLRMLVHLRLKTVIELHA